MIEGKLYRCTKICNTTRGVLKPGELLLCTKFWDFQGVRRGRWRKGTGHKFLWGDKALQARFVTHKWEEYFELVETEDDNEA